MLEILCLDNFFKFHNTFLSGIQGFKSAKPPEKQAFADSTVPMALTVFFFMKLEKNSKAPAYFKCYLQQYSLFSIVSLCTQKSKSLKDMSLLKKIMIIFFLPIYCVERIWRFQLDINFIAKSWENPYLLLLFILKVIFCQFHVASC